MHKAVSIDGRKSTTISSNMLKMLLKRNMGAFKDEVFTLRANSCLSFYPINCPCICCGETGLLNRHHVFPHQYMRGIAKPEDHKFFSEFGKTNIVILCIDCHVNYEKASTQLMKIMHASVAEEFLKESKFSTMKIFLIKECIRLADHLNKIGIEETEEREFFEKRLEEIVQEKPTPELIKYILNVKESIFIGRNHIIANKLMASKLQDCVFMFQKHFLFFAKPKFIPYAWNMKEPTKDETISAIEKVIPGWGERALDLNYRVSLYSESRCE